MKRQKYGYIYRTHLFGNPTVRVTGAENVRHVLTGENKLVSVQWPASVRTILGSDTLSNVHGAMHKSKKKVGLDFGHTIVLVESTELKGMMCESARSCRPPFTS